MSSVGVVNVHHYTKIGHELAVAVRDLSGIVLFAHNSIEFTDIVDVLNLIRPGQFCTLLYISLIRSYRYMKAALDQQPLQNKRISVIDCVSGFTFPVEDRIDDCLYHKPPHDLEDMKEIIAFGIEKANPDIIVFDSLSQFINFSQPSEEDLHGLSNFLGTLRYETMNVVQNTMVFLYDDRLGATKYLSRMAVDTLIKLELAKDKACW